MEENEWDLFFQLVNKINSLPCSDLDKYHTIWEKSKEYNSLLALGKLTATLE